MRKYTNEWERLREQANYYREQYPPGTRILLISMGEDIQRVPDDTRGIVKAVDDIGTLHCSFDNGRSSGLVPGEDKFSKLTEAELAEKAAAEQTAADEPGSGIGDETEDSAMMMGR